MSDPEYAPFPQVELERMAENFDTTATDCMNRYGIEDVEFLWDSAKALRSAIASYKALNERCLRAELALNHGIKEPAS